MALRVKPYILAGGKSSRMGRDKAMLKLEGKTLLARAVATLRSVTALQSQDGRLEVTVCGDRDEFEGADRAIVDRYASCGPMGGIEAALSDLSIRQDAEWAFFIPVDMPLLSSRLIEQLLGAWSAESLRRAGVKAFLVEVDQRPQPLVSLIHKSVLDRVRDALQLGKYKVVPMLESAGASYTSFDQGHLIGEPGAEVKRSVLFPDRPAPVSKLNLNYHAIDASQSERTFIEISQQFINVNTEDDLKRVATLLGQVGSNKQPEDPAR